MHMKRALFTALAVVGLGALGSRAYASDPIDATITVTPNVTVDLALSVTTYAFGQLNVGVNVSSVTASSITLRNVGTIDVTIDKSITNAGGWTAANIAGSGTPGVDTFALYVATGTARPAKTDFAVAPHLFNGTGGANKLMGIGGVDVSTITVSGGAMNEAYMWFRLDMPTQVTSGASREISMRFDGVALP
jgi:hypothetical protein